jgi:hypothetical protein
MSTESLFILTFWILGSLREFEIFGEIWGETLGIFLGEVWEVLGSLGRENPLRFVFSQRAYIFLLLKP